MADLTNEVPDAVSLGFDMASPAFLRDPYTAYARMREQAPLLRIPLQGHPLGRLLLVTRYADVSAVTGDARRFTSDSRSVYGQDDYSGGEEPSMIFLDPPAHTRLRRRVAADFTPKRVATLEEPIRRIVDEHLGAALARGGFDLIAEVAAPIPVLVICELLGIPEADRGQLAHWAQEVIDTTGLGTAGKDVQARNQAANAALGSYFVGFVEVRKAEPDDGLLSAIMEPGEDEMSVGELVAMCVLLLIAGHETTVNLIGNGVRTLLRHAEQWRRLVDEPALAAGAVEEVLRFEPPVQRPLFRAGQEPVELAGFMLEPGEQLLASIAAANRDPAVFDDPERFDIAREPNRHLSFGRGVHFCLGAPLARLEGRLVFERLSELSPDLRVVGEDDDWRPSTLFRGLKALKVAVG